MIIRKSSVPQTGLADQTDSSQYYYVFTYGYKKKLYTITLRFTPPDRTVS